MNCDTFNIKYFHKIFAGGMVLRTAHVTWTRVVVPFVRTRCRPLQSMVLSFHNI